MANYTKLTPFKMCVLQNFPFIEADFDALTNYELMCKIVEYLNKVINQQNITGERVDILLNWFNNLDVQDEINNKLDSMVESGELQEIISIYLNSKAIFGFNNVSEMKASTNLINGSYANTLGYYNINDGGKALYKIRTLTNLDVVDNMFKIALDNDNTLIAELICDNELNLKQIGAKGDNVQDDTLYLQSAVNYGLPIYIPNGSYKITDTININTQTQIKGESMTNTIINSNTNNYLFEYLSEVQTALYDIKTSICFDNLRIIGENIFHINNETLSDTQWRLQASLLHLIFQNLFISGKYLDKTDSNKDTNIIADLTELKSYGLAFNLSNIFDSEIRDCDIEKFGLAIYLKGCDINKISDNRLIANGNHIYTERVSTYGSQNRIVHNDMVRNYRYGAIRINYTFWDTIEDNYFEDYTNSACFIYGNHEYGLSVLNNRFDDPMIADFNIINLSPIFCDKVVGNKVTPSSGTPYLNISKDNLNFNLRNLNCAIVNDNSSSLLIRNNPFMLRENYNPLLISPKNLKSSEVTMSGSRWTSPYVELDSTNNQYYFKIGTSGQTLISIYKNLIENYGKPLKLRFKYRNTGSTTSFYIAVTNQDNGQTIKNGLVSCINDGNIHIAEVDIGANDSTIYNNVRIELPRYDDFYLYSFELI